jgi:predicted metal-binding membrane protein
MTVTALENVLRHDRWFLGAGIALIAALAWAWLLAGAGMSFDGIEMTRMSFGESALMDMTMTNAGEWSAMYVLIMFSMWWIMMIAMMLPSAAPVILLAAAINRNSNSARKPFGATTAFTLGYLFGWAGFSAVAVAAQWALTTSGLLSGMLVSKSDLLSGGILVAAGLWQFTALKSACLRHCRSPVHFLTQDRRAGYGGAILMGLRHSLYCVACCWFLMLLLFVGGVMNLVWVAALAIYVWVERSLPAGGALSKITGAILVTAGIFLIL